MIKKILGKLHKTSGFILLLSPILAWMIMIFLKVNPILFINKNLGTYGEQFYDYVTKNDLNHSVNYAIIISLINCIAYIFAFAPKFTVSIKNVAMKNDTSVLRSPANSNHRASKFTVHIEVDYIDFIWYTIITKLLGGIIIEIDIPGWAEGTLNNFPWDTSQFASDNHQSKIIIDLIKALEDKLIGYEGETIVGMDIITNMSTYFENTIKIKIKNRSNNFFRKTILKILIYTIFNTKCKEHNIRIEI